MSPTTPTPETPAQTVAIPATVTVKRLSELLALPVTAVITELMRNKIMATINEEIDYDTASIIAQDLGFVTTPDVTVGDQDTLTLETLLEICRKEKGSGKNLRERPPIVTILGHVDHGKTTLLDAIRKTSVAAGEAGGITQHISAYQVRKRGRLITFIDTPGHAAFAAMRERGVSIADIAILVVAADDGVRPQTEEVIRYLTEKKIPTVVAINKIDKPEADILRVKKELSERGLLVEEWGGKVVANEISARNNIGITELLESLLLVADMEEFRADESRDGLAVVLEAHMDPNKGAIATAVILTGTLKVGQDISAGGAYGRIRRLEDSSGRNITQAPPSTPVTIYGLGEIPQVNDVIQVMSGKVAARVKAQHHVVATASQRLTTGDTTVSLTLILKSDVQGSLEAIEQIIAALPQSKIAVHIVASGIGNITESDIKMATGADALVYGFNVTATTVAKRLAEEAHVSIRIFQIIYEIVDDIKKELLARLPHEAIRTDTGTLEILGIFRTEKDRMIIGGKVRSGTVVAHGKAEIVRDDAVAGTCAIVSLQNNKVDVKEVEKGAACGLTVTTSTRIKKGDLLRIYTEETLIPSLE